MKEIINTYIPKNYTSLLQLLANVWALTICFPALQGSFYGVFALLLWGVFKGEIDFSLKYNVKDNFWKSKKTPFYFLLAYLLWMTATIFWSDNIREYFRQFEKLIPLYLLAFIGFMEGIDKHINFNKVLNAFLWGVLIAMGYMVVRMGVDMFTGDTIGQLKVNGLINFNIFLYINHRTYIGITLLMAIPLFMQTIRVSDRKNQILIAFFITLINLFAIMSGARVLMILSVLVTLYSLQTLYHDLISRRTNTLAIFALLSLSSVLILKTERIQEKAAQLKENSSINEIEDRINIWEAASKLIINKPICGYGLGDGLDELFEQYYITGYKKALDREYNPHNQYLQILLTGGLTSLLLFCLFLYFLLKLKSSQKSVLFIPFIIVNTVSLFVESLLVRNIGVFPFVFFVILLLADRDFSYKSYRKTLLATLSTILLVFISLFIVSKLLPIYSKYPNTYMLGDYNTVKYRDLPHKEQLPKATNSLVVLGKELKLGNHGCYSYANIFKFPKNLHGNINFSVWCYSENTSLTSLRATVRGSEGTVSTNYDLNKRGWQQLKVNYYGELKSLQIYTISTTDKESDTKDIYFTHPQLLFNDTEHYYK